MPAITMPTTNTDTDLMRIQTSSADTSRSAAKAKLAAKGMSADKIDEAAQDFEAQFVSQMLGNMFSTVDTKGFLDGGDSEEIYRSMMIDQYGKLIAKAGGIGVADHVKREMLRMQEV